MSRYRLRCEERAKAYSIADLPGSIACRITIHPESGCWVVSGHLDKDGYARIGGEGAHRVVYKLLAGEIPEDRPQLDHVVKLGCISRACCWPAHLEPVTARTNFRKTHCGRCGAGFDLFNTYHYRGRRDCRRCIARRVREYRKRKRQRAIVATLARGADLGRAA
jgi:hypothetical protein